ncbi:MAG: hypothetical protein ACLFQS_06720 [Bacteroidales bacterium]
MDRFENEIKNKLGQFESMPPDDLWSRIENDLDNDKTRQGFVWYKLAAAVLILIVSVFSAWFFLPSFFAENRQLAKENERTQPEMHLDENNSPDENNTYDQSPQQNNKPVDPDSPNETGLQNSVSGSAMVDHTEKEVETDQPGIHSDSPMTSSPLPNEEVKIFTTKSPANKTNLVLLPMMGEAKILTTTAYLLNTDKSAAMAYELEEKQVQKLIKPDISSSSPNGFSLAAFVMPQESYRMHNSNSSYPFSSAESDVFSFGAGIHVAYTVNSRWKMRTGLTYTRIGQKVNDIAAFTHPSMMHLYSADGKTVADHPQSMSTSMGAISFTNQRYYFADVRASRIFTLKGSYDESNVNLLNKTGMGLLQHFDYLEIPLIVQYNLWNKNFSLDVKAGFNANFLLSGNVYLQGSSYFRPVGKSVGNKTFNVSGSTGLVASYPIGHHLNVEVEPTFSMFLSPIGNSNPHNQTYPYNYSLMIGLSYDF